LNWQGGFWGKAKGHTAEEEGFFPFVGISHSVYSMVFARNCGPGFEKNRDKFGGDDLIALDE